MRITEKIRSLLPPPVEEPSPVEEHLNILTEQQQRYYEQRIIREARRENRLSIDAKAISDANIVHQRKRIDPQMVASFLNLPLVAGLRSLMSGSLSHYIGCRIIAEELLLDGTFRLHLEERWVDQTLRVTQAFGQRELSHSGVTIGDALERLFWRLQEHKMRPEQVEPVEQRTNPRMVDALLDLQEHA